MGDFTKFKNTIIELTDLFEELSLIEKDKLNAVADNNLKGLEDCMKDEQVSIMRLKVLEKKREESQADLGLSGLSFKEIIEKLDGSQVLEMGELYTKLEDALTVFNRNAESAKRAIEANLYSINSVLEQLKESNVEKVERPKSFSSKKV